MKLKMPIDWFPRIGLIGFVVVFLCLSGRAYYGEHLFTKAELGPKTVSDYNSMIQKAWNAAPYYNESSIRYAQFLQAHGKWQTSVSVLNASAAGNWFWQGWEMQGAALENFAFSETGTLDDAKLAAVYYDKMLKVYPSNIKGLERRAVLGLKMGDWETVDQLAADILSIQSYNPNALYLRGRIAEAKGDRETAVEIYGSILANGNLPQDALYSISDIRDRIRAVGDSES